MAASKMTLKKMKKMRYGGIDHVNVMVANTAASRQFYTNALGMEDVTHLRTNLSFPGAWVCAGAQQVHLMEQPNPDPTSGRPEYCARDRHVAFTIRELAPLKALLDEHGIVYAKSKSGRAALFCRDPDGNALEFMGVPSPKL
eukprot:gene37051-61527_t